MAQKLKLEPYDRPAGGWGSVKSVADSLVHEHAPLNGGVALYHQNKPDGFACVSCSWAKPGKPHLFEFCENGAKATTWEITHFRAGPEFFAAHTVSELEHWPDHELEEVGRLTDPLRYDPATDRYLPVSWADAFAEIGRELRALDPRSVVCYASGRASLETSYLYALFARLYGNNNLPDSSNMCHESTSVGPPLSIGVPVGTVTLADFEQTDCMLFFGHNTGSNAPRMLHQLQEARQRGVPILVFNPLREKGHESFTNPQNPVEMLTGAETRISSQYHQVKAGGDIAAILGICKALIERDDAGEPVLDHQFIAEHTHGFETFADRARQADWAKLERKSGLGRAAMEAAAAVYARARTAMALYGMGLTQHRTGVENVRMVANLLLLRGNIGKPGAGICPIRGHSNVQGQRTVGITEKVKLAPNDKLRELYGFEPPDQDGLATVDACQGIIDGNVRGFLSLGGNFVRAIPERGLMEQAWRTLRLTVQIATKPNRSHVIHGEVAFILPCLGRIEVDEQASGPQLCSVEDSTACIHASRGIAAPAGPNLLSETRIVAALAKAALPPNPRVDWDAWAGDYSLIREAIEATYPDQFKDFNARFQQPGGFHRPLAACERRWNTESGKAEFVTPESLEEDPDAPVADHDVLQLVTLRSNGQFNTTIYRYDDRFRGIYGNRMVVLMNRNDIERLGLEEGGQVSLVTVVDDAIERRMEGFTIVGYDIPEGCIGGYYPECNALIPLWHHAKDSKVPAAKSIPVRVSAVRAQSE